MAKTELTLVSIADNLNINLFACCNSHKYDRYVSLHFKFSFVVGFELGSFKMSFIDVC